MRKIEIDEGRKIEIIEFFFSCRKTRKPCTALPISVIIMMIKFIQDMYSTTVHKHNTANKIPKSDMSLKPR